MGDSTASWRSTKLTQLGKIVTGRTPPSTHPEFFGDEYPFITPSDMNGQRYMIQTERYLSLAGQNLLRSLLLPEGAICVSCIGWQLGKVALVDRPSITNQQLNSIIPNANIDSRFLYYSLCTRRNQIRNLGSVGTRTPIVNKSVFSSIEIKLPQLIIQRHIADILGAYDDLIENNTRRIAILEEMARRLYEEWFVRFRFPGHEHVRMVDSPLGKVPEGWAITTLGSVAKFRRGDAGATKATYTEAGYIAYSAAGPDGRRPGYDRDGPAIVLSAVGANCGRTWYAQGRWSCIANTMYFYYKGEEAANCFLYLLTHGKEFWPRRGSAQPFIASSDAEATVILLPSSSVLVQFENTIDPLYSMCKTMELQRQNLQAQRELLLPKLVSGEIDVSNALTGREVAA